MDGEPAQYQYSASDRFTGHVYLRLYMNESAAVVAVA